MLMRASSEDTAQPDAGNVDGEILRAIVDNAVDAILVIDEKGIIQYAYVGEHRADRPATNALIKLIEGM